jgi:sec-independent protein translocase protein TatC
MPLALKTKRTEARNPSVDPEEFRAPLHVHLDELRVRLIRSLWAICIAWVLAWFVAPHAVNAITNQAFSEISKKPPIVVTDITLYFMTQLKVSFAIALTAAMPIIINQIWGFVAPGLKENEKKPIVTVAPITVALFFLGCLFCWFVLPQCFAWFGTFMNQFPNTDLIQDQERLVVFSVKMMAAFGVCFQLPLIVYVLGRIGILSPDTMIQYWRQVVVFIFFVAAAVTPSSDPGSMMMIGIPLCVLFVISVYAVKFTTRKQAILEPVDEFADIPALD